MREILFKGKCEKEGDWHFGHLFQTDSGTICILEKYVPLKELNYFEVDPETVCQYTGLTDKNGRKIFEGDILKIPEKKNHNVKFEYGQFCVGINCPIAYIRTECEVIGNIFDNPELIGE